MPLENVLESLHKKKLQGPEQLQTAMYNQKLNRVQATPSNHKLRKMVRQHFDQTIRTRNFKARNEIIETGVLVKSHKGRNVSAQGKVGDCCQFAESLLPVLEWTRLATAGPLVKGQYGRSVLEQLHSDENTKITHIDLRFFVRLDTRVSPTLLSSSPSYLTHA